ncbi:MAG TPA: DUF364 domain-containing protein [Candidatus Binatia bacterium]
MQGLNIPLKFSSRLLMATGHLASIVVTASGVIDIRSVEVRNYWRPLPLRRWTLVRHDRPGPVERLATEEMRSAPLPHHASRFNRLTTPPPSQALHRALGGTSPWPPPFFSRGVHVLGGIRVRNPDKLLQVVSEGGSGYFFEDFSEKVCVVRADAGHIGMAKS